MILTTRGIILIATSIIFFGLLFVNWFSALLFYAVALMLIFTIGRG